MIKSRLFKPVHIHFSMVTTLLFTTLAMPAYAFLSTPLVKVANIEPWHRGDISIINCQISVPFLTAFSSESGAKLTYLLPKGSEVKKGQLIAEQQNYYYLVLQ